MLEDILFKPVKAIVLKSPQVHLAGQSARFPFIGEKAQGIGIDPGRQFGIAVVLDQSITTYHGKLPGVEKTSDYGLIAWDVAKTFFDSKYPKWRAVIEGASYGDRFGQVLLEQIRYSFFTSMRYLNINSELMPPNKVRKIAFGDGFKTGPQIWPLLSEHAADAVGCALVAAGFDYDAVYEKVMGDETP